MNLKPVICHESGGEKDPIMPKKVLYCISPLNMTWYLISCKGYISYLPFITSYSL